MKAVAKDLGQGHGAVPASESYAEYLYRDPWAARALYNLHGFSVQLLINGGSGAIARTAVAPLERAKILLQVQDYATPKHSYRGLIDALRRIPAEEGYKALFRGNGANCLRIAPEWAVKFALHDQFTIMFKPVDGTAAGIPEKLAAAAATGVVKTLAFHPLDVCRTRLTAHVVPRGGAPQYHGLWHCLGATWQAEGLAGCYRGLLLSLVTVAPYLAVSFTAYDELKSLLPADRRSRSLWWYPFATIGCGVGAAAAAQTLLYPLDTLRRRMQVAAAVPMPPPLPAEIPTRWGWLRAHSPAAPQHRSPHYVELLYQAWRGGATKSLWRGWSAGMAKTVPGATIQFLAYDLINCTMNVLDPTAGTSSPL